jgi:hypothetical protein
MRHSDYVVVKVMSSYSARQEAVALGGLSQAVNYICLQWLRISLAK